MAGTMPRSSGKWLRRVLLLLGILLGLAAAGWFAARASLKRQVVSQLAAWHDGPITVEQVQPGIGSQRLRGLALRDPATGEPWVTVERIDLDLSLWEALRGRTEPHALTLHRPRVVVRFDEQGQLLNRLPAFNSPTVPGLPAERIALFDGVLAVEQTGRAPLEIGAIEAAFQQGAEHIRGTAEVADFLQARWTLAAEIDRRAGVVSWKLSTADVNLERRALAALPLVPRGALEGVNFAASTALDGRGSWQPGAEPRYRIELSPRAYRITLGGQELPFRGGGRLVAEDGMVSVEALQAELFDGRLRVSGRADLRERPWTGTLTARVEGIAVSKLPVARDALPALSGTASGTGQFEWELNERTRIVRGTARGEVRDPKLGALAFRPVEVQLDLRQEQPIGAAWTGAAWTEPGALTGQARLHVDLVETELDEAARMVRHFTSIAPLPEVSGRMALRSTVSIPLESYADPLSYRAEGTLQLAEPSIAEVPLKSLEASWQFADGRLGTSPMVLRLGDEAQIAGSLELDLRAAEPRLESELELTRIPASLLAKAAPGRGFLQGPWQGHFSGSLRASVAPADWPEVTAWTVAGDLEAAELGRGEFTARDVSVPFQLRQGTVTAPSARAARVRLGDVQLHDLASRLTIDGGMLTAEDVRARWNESPLRGRLEMGLAAPHPFSAEYSASDVSIRSAAELAGSPTVRQELGEFQVLGRIPPGPLPLPDDEFPIRGALQLSGHAEGALVPLDAKLRGTLASETLAWENLTANQLRATWRLDSQQLQLDELRFEALGGEVLAKGSVAWNDAGGGELNGTFRRIDARQIAAQWPAVQGRADQGRGDPPADFSGKIDGSFSLTQLLDRDRWAGELRFEGLDASYHELVVTGLQGQLGFADDALTIKVDGSWSDAPVGFAGEVKWGTRGLEDASLAGKVELSGVRVRQLFPLTGVPADWRRLGGEASARMSVTAQGPGWKPEGNGRVVLRALSWDGTRVSESVECRATLEAGVVRLSELSGRVAGGSVQGNLTWNPRGPGQGSFQLQGERLAVDRLVAPWKRRLPTLDGRLSVSLRGRLGSDWRGTGKFTLLDGTLAGVPLDMQRVPFDWIFVPRNGHFATNLQFTSARLASGRLTGKVAAKWSGRLKLAAELQLRRARMRQLAQASGAIRRSLSGRLDAEVRLQGSDVDSLESLTGTYKASLAQSQALSLPVLNSLTGSLGVSSPTSETFSETVAEGAFRRGILTIDKLTMQSSQAQLFIEGTVTTRGRLDLDVTADTAQVAAAGVALGVLRPLDFLRRRLLFLHVGGSIRSPSVTPRTAEFVEQELVQFFLPWATTATVVP